MPCHGFSIKPTSSRTDCIVYRAVGCSCPPAAAVGVYKRLDDKHKFDTSVTVTCERRNSTNSDVGRRLECYVLPRLRDALPGCGKWNVYEMNV